MHMKLSKIRFLTLLIFLLMIPQIYAQQFTNFKNFTDMKRVTALQTNNSGIWGATSGGGFFFNSGTNNFTTL